MANKPIFWLTLSLSLILSISAWARDIKPLHTCVQTGLFMKSLGNAATAKDRYRVTCPISTKSFRAQVRDRAPVVSPVLRINITASSNSGSSNGVRLDNVDGNGSTAQCTLTGFSGYTTRTLTTASTGSVTFDFEVYKDVAGSENYDVSEECLNSSGMDLGNASYLTVLQNQ